MTKSIALLFLAGGMLAAQPVRTYVGVITCTMCKNDHRGMGITPEDRCVRECIRHGAKYALFDGKNLYRLSDQQAPEKFAAQKVRITGVLFEKTGVLRVDKIEPLASAKSQAAKESKEAKPAPHHH